MMATDSVLSMFLELEWSSFHLVGYDGWAACCPVCKGVKPGDAFSKDTELDTHVGHSKDCRLQRMIAEFKCL